ncbi:unnamed protein product [Mucor hiemalis]
MLYVNFSILKTSITFISNNMQLQFISLGLIAAVLMTAVNADTVGVSGNDVRVNNVGTDILSSLNVDYVADDLDVVVAHKRSLSASKKVASAIRRRAIARRSEEADEEEEDEDENDDEENTDEESTQEESTEEDDEESVAAAAEDDESADNEEETSEDSEWETSEDAEEDNSEWERRDGLTGGLPIVGDLLGGSTSDKGSSGGILGGL